MPEFPAYLIVALIGVIAWAAVAIVAIIMRYRRRPAEDQTAALDTVLNRLDSLDARLAKVEKTLTDIP